MPSNHFDGPTAVSYDAHHASRFTAEMVDPAVDFLAAVAALADGHPVLEFAIGTGRIALPLQARGIEVHGIEFSPAMLEQFQAKPGSDSITTAVGDMAEFGMGRTYGLVYLVFNTIGNLMTQAEQVACFRNAARHLVDGGHFVIESNVPHLRQLTPGSTGRVFDSSDEHAGLDHYTDLVAQQAVSRHFFFEGGPGTPRTGTTSVRYEETPYRFVWPSELDLMAQLADMRLTERWSDWHRNPFEGNSPAHISVWRKD